jgi:type I restriction enzyme S subunit
MIFYKETEFKEEPFVGKVPTDWDVTKLGDESISEIVMGQSPPSSTYNKEGVGLPFLQGKMEFGDIFPKILVYCSEPIKIAQPNDVLFSVRAPVGDVNLAPCKLCIGRGLAAIRFNNEMAHHLFYFYYFQRIKKHLEALGKGSTFKAINKGDLANLPIPLPSLREQKMIVGVLGVVDSAIELVDKVIWKTERLKKGLMQTLLTRGIGHKEYKQTPIGTTPKTWKVVKLQDVAEIRSNRSINDFEKIAFIPMELIPESQIFAKYQIRAKKDVKSFTYCKAGDLLLAKITPSLENGKQGIVPPEVPNKVALATTEVFPICCKEINRFFLFYVLKFSKFRNKIISSMTGTTGRQRASKEGVKRLEIPLPPLNEQMKIAEILSNVDRKLELEKNERARLECIKQGLMNLLLTGRIRVKVD